MRNSTRYLIKFFLNYDSFKREYYNNQIKYRKDGLEMRKYLIMRKELTIEDNQDIIDSFFSYMMNKTSLFSVIQILYQIDQPDKKEFKFLSVILKNQVNIK